MLNRLFKFRKDCSSAGQMVTRDVNNLSDAGMSVQSLLLISNVAKLKVMVASYITGRIP